MKPAVGAGQETREEVHQSLQGMRRIYQNNRAYQRTVKTNRTPVKDAIDQSSNIAGSADAVMDSYAPKSKPFFSDKLSNLSKGAKIGKYAGLGLTAFVGAISIYNNINNYGLTLEAYQRIGYDVGSLIIAYGLTSLVAIGIGMLGLTAAPALALTIGAGILIGQGVSYISEELKRRKFD